MNDATIEILTRRLDRLERAARRRRLVVTLGALGLAGLTLTGAASPRAPRAVARPAPPRTMEVGKLVLKDPSGRVAAELSVDSTGRPALVLLEEGRIRTTLAIDADGAAVLGLDSRDGGSVRLDGNGLALHGRDKSKRAVLALASDDSPALLFLNREDANKPHAALIMGEAGPRLVFYDKSGLEDRAPLWLGLGPSAAQPRLQLKDENGHDRAVLGHVSLKSITNDQVQDRPISSLVLFDKEGTVLWRAP